MTLTRTFSFFLALCFLLTPLLVFAQWSIPPGAIPPGGTNTSPPGGTNTLPPGGTNTSPPGGTNTSPPGGTNTSPSPAGKIPNPLTNDIRSIHDLVYAILNKIVLPIGSVIVVFFIIYSGFLFVAAQGNDKKLQDAKNTFLYTLIGAAILLGSVALAAAIKGSLCEIAPSFCNQNNI